MTPITLPAAPKAPDPPAPGDCSTSSVRSRGRPGIPNPGSTPSPSWVVAFVIFHGKRHPLELDHSAIGQFLDHVVQTRRNPLSALEGARTALTVLYQNLLGRDLGPLPQPRPPRLLDQVRQVVLPLGHYSLQTEKSYVHWATRFIVFHGKRHPRDMRAPEVEQFLTLSRHGYSTCVGQYAKPGTQRPGLSLWPCARHRSRPVRRRASAARQAPASRARAGGGRARSCLHRGRGRSVSSHGPVAVRGRVAVNASGAGSLWGLPPRAPTDPYVPN